MNDKEYRRAQANDRAWRMANLKRNSPCKHSGCANHGDAERGYCAWHALLHPARPRKAKVVAQPVTYPIIDTGDEIPF